MPDNGRHHVVIVGGGFAGLGCAQKLADHDDIQVTLIDVNNYHQFQPLLYQVATSQLAGTDIAHSLRGVFADRENVDVKLAEISGVDTASRTVISKDGESCNGDVLVLRRPQELFDFWAPQALVPLTHSTTRRVYARASSACSSRSTETRA
jgi:NADH dehydrogenase